VRKNGDDGFKGTRDKQMSQCDGEKTAQIAPRKPAPNGRLERNQLCAKGGTGQTQRLERLVQIWTEKKDFEDVATSKDTQANWRNQEKKKKGPLMSFVRSFV